MKPDPLSVDAIASLTTLLPSWQVEGRELVKTFAFASYLGGIDFVRRLAIAAEEMNHHPEILIGWRKVTVRLTTHSAATLTDLDVELARKAESLVGS